jgi:hypothetical protein
MRRGRKKGYMARRHKAMRAINRAFTAIVSIALILVLAPLMFSFGTLTGIGYCVSCALALWRGALGRDILAAVFIAIGYAITWLAARVLLPRAYNDLLAQSFVNAALVLAAFLLIWWRTQHLKKGKWRR